MKEYKSNEELIDYLISKNVTVINREDAIKKIEKYSYYSVINSYKSNFKDKNNNYKPNVTFDEIYALYQFDKNLKHIFLKYTLEIETQIKSLMANLIAEKYGIKNYLDINNFDENAEDKVKEELIERINSEIEDDYKVHSAIKHYKDKYGYIPPFVLTKILSFGIISSYYGLLKQNDRQNIAKYFKVSDKMLKQILKNLTMVRNIAAHSDRLYCFRSKHNISFKNIDNTYINNSKTTNLYMIIKTMEYLLDEEQKNNFSNEIDKELSSLENNLVSIKIEEIKNIVGYPVHKID